jgi:hypothetical protein
MPPKTTEAEFDALVARAGLPLTAVQKAGIYAVFGGVEAMQAMVRGPAPAVASVTTLSPEPSNTFSTEPGR